ALDAYYAVVDSTGRIDVDAALPLFFPNRDGVYSSAMRLATAMALAGARALFAVPHEGDYVARSRDDAARRWKLFARADYVRMLGCGADVRTASGQVVQTTGVCYADSFEATADGSPPVRVSYRRVLLPGEEPVVRPSAPAAVQP